MTLPRKCNPTPAPLSLDAIKALSFSLSLSQRHFHFLTEPRVSINQSISLHESSLKKGVRFIPSIHPSIHRMRAYSTPTHKTFAAYLIAFHAR